MPLSGFFFQAEDGIRDKLVTGVQTCALPICFPSFPTSGIVRWPEVGKLGKQIAVGPHLVLCHLPVCEDSQEGVSSVVGERPAIAREGCWAGGVVGQHIRQQSPCRSPCLLRRIPTCVLQSMREGGNEAGVVRRLTRQIGFPLRPNEKDGLRGQRAAVR